MHPEPMCFQASRYPSLNDLASEAFSFIHQKCTETRAISRPFNQSDTFPIQAYALLCYSILISKYLT